jgi:hypothetical protein
MNITLSVTIATLSGLKIGMYPHGSSPPPHGAAYFKVFKKTGRSPHPSATLLIEDLDGTPPFNSGITPAELHLVRTWAKNNLNALRANWKECLAGRTPKKLVTSSFFKGLWVQNFKYLKDYLVEIEFSNGEIRVVDFSPILTNAPGDVGDILTKGLFPKAALEDGTLLWPNGVDFDPDGLYEVSEPISQQQIASST